MEFFWYLAFAYALIILFFFLGLFRNNFRNNDRFESFSVIVAARNEEKNLPGLLSALVSQNYPREKFEIIISDDRSEDDTAKVVKEFQKDYPVVKMVSISEENPELVGKKGAITAAVNIAEKDILAFTDADCLPTPNWLREINRHFSQNVDFVAGYSVVDIKKKLWFLLKNLERSAFFAVIAGAFGFNWPLTATAGNMAYRKKIFYEVEGFKGIGHIRSGDDDLMLHKLQKKIRRLRFMFSLDAIVQTQGCENWNQQIQQETRRGSKWKYYPTSVKTLTLLVMLFYISYVVLFAGTLFNFYSWYLFGMITLIKIIPEFLLCFAFLNKMKNLKFILVFPLAELVYIPYFIFFGLKGTFGKYRWKD